MSVGENFSVIVLGGMNPRLHHPMFYSGIKLISADDEKVLLQSNTTLCTPQIAQLDLPGVGRILCLPDRWQIASEDEAQANRLLGLAAAVMTALDHTPVGTFGFNFDYLRLAARPQAAAHLASLARGLPLGLDHEGDQTAAFILADRRAEPDAKRVVTTTVDGLIEPANHISVRNNFNYEVLVQGHFDVGAMMQARFERDHAEARAQADRSVKAIDGRA